MCWLLLLRKYCVRFMIFTEEMLVSGERVLQWVCDSRGAWLPPLHHRVLWHPVCATEAHLTGNSVSSKHWTKNSVYINISLLKFSDEYSLLVKNNIV